MVTKKDIQSLIASGLVTKPVPAESVIGRAGAMKMQHRFFVPLTVEEFDFASAAARAAYHGQMPVDADAVTGRGIVFPDGDVVHLTNSRLNRSMYAGGRTFGKECEKAASFYWRTIMIAPLTYKRKYRKYVNPKKGEIHPAMMLAVCKVEGHSLMDKAAIEVAFELEFLRQLIAHRGED